MRQSSDINLGQALKAENVVGTGGEAKILIQAGEVRVNGKVETRRGRKLSKGDIIEVREERIEIR